MAMDDEKLIEHVRKYPVLYDFAHEKYMNVNFKLKIWDDIGKELKQEGSVCKTRWTNIRDIYRKSLRKVKTKSGQKKIKLYKYSKQLCFLKNFFKRGIEGNVDDTPEHEQSTSENETDQNDTVDTDTKLLTEPETKPLQFEDKNNENEQDDNVPPPRKLFRKIHWKNQNNSDVPPPKKRFKKIQPGTSSSTLLTLPPSIHPIDAFLMGVSASLKTLKPYYLHMAKSEIFSTTQKYEMKMIVDGGTTCNESSSSCSDSPISSPISKAMRVQSPIESFDPLTIVSTAFNKQ